MIGIYKITNLINNKVYIGQSTDIKRRWKDHRKEAFWRNSSEYEYPLYRAIRKYGLQNFSFEMVEECSKSELNAKEKFYIAQYDSYNTGYNQTEGGDSVSHNQKLTQSQVTEIIQRLKTTHDNIYVIAKDFNVGGTTIHYINKGQQYPQPNETYPIRPHLATLHEKPTCSICGAVVTKKNHLCKTCANTKARKAARPTPLQLAQIITENGFEGAGKQFGVSGKTIAKWCKSYQIPSHKQELIAWYNQQLGISTPTPKCRNTTNRIKPVKQIDMTTGQICDVFPNATEAAHSLGKNKGTHISDVCNGKRMQAYGYYWTYTQHQ